MNKPTLSCAEYYKVKHPLESLHPAVLRAMADKAMTPQARRLVRLSNLMRFLESAYTDAYLSEKDEAALKTVGDEDGVLGQTIVGDLRYLHRLGLLDRKAFVSELIYMPGRIWGYKVKRSSL